MREAFDQRDYGGSDYKEPTIKKNARPEPGVFC
jgi:hypothetical protein